MPSFSNRTVIVLPKKIRAFLRLDVGLIRGPVPDFGAEGNGAKQKDRQLKQVRERLSATNAELQKLRRTRGPRRREPEGQR